jgi:OOP family OmpA-OmpF porin
MMKFSLLSIALLCSLITLAQKEKPTYNRWSIDVNAGLNKTVRNFAPGYNSSLADFGEVNLGVRYMFNPYVGTALKFGFDRFHDSKESPDFASNLGRVELQGIVNVGNVLNFYQWTERIGLLAHLGIGRANFVQSGFPMPIGKSDRIGTLTFGLSPQFKLGSKWAINLDASVVGLARLHHTWDYTQTTYTGNKAFDYGMNGHFFTGTIGVSYYIGKKDQHADWSPTKSVSKSELDSLKADMERMRNGMNDDDKDGVPNYLDQEPNSPEGSTVNSRGMVDPTIADTDKDGIADAYDACPDQKGKFSANGCPDKDNDGVADKDDECPDVAGSMANNGCPGGGSGSGCFSSTYKKGNCKIGQSSTIDGS